MIVLDRDQDDAATEPVRDQRVARFVVGSRHRIDVVPDQVGAPGVASRRHTARRPLGIHVGEKRGDDGVAGKSGNGRRRVFIQGLNKGDVAVVVDVEPVPDGAEKIQPIGKHRTDVYPLR